MDDERYYDHLAIKEATKGYFERHFEEKPKNKLYLSDPIFKALQDDDVAT
ncbi:Retrovirus-related Pol polyprotein LINE-1 [Sesbania bispinosa]|nr:Retrovirus-related Pol polyprotein LINE-1 [Sesbania bispinosa]